MRRTAIALVLATLLAGSIKATAAGATNWVEAVVRLRAQPQSDAWRALEERFPVECDWVRQDLGTAFAQWLTASNDQALAAELGRVIGAAPVDSSLRNVLDRYLEHCEQRRQGRLESMYRFAREAGGDSIPRVVFTKRRTVRPSFFAYTEGQSDAQSERHFLPGSELCVMTLEGTRARVETLLADRTGVIRDPAVSWDGKRILFAWKKSLNEDDYHLYEMEVSTRAIRQVTSGLGFADYEPCYLPNDDIVFASTRSVQTVDCFWTEVSNLYVCDKDGKNMRRVGYDQVHTVYPQVLDDGRVIYTRWDYNDRGQVFPQALFQMNPDGTGQSEFYGNSSWFPTTIAHARGIPGTQRVLAIFCGHHSPQAGKLGVVDPAKGRQENAGAQLVAPVRATPAVRIDAYGQEGELFQYPYPISETEFLVTYAPDGWEGVGPRRGDAAFSIYWMNMDGQRELLAADASLPCSQPVPLAPRNRPALRPSVVNHAQDTGTVYLQDVYAGPGLQGVARGSVKRLRVVALEFRAAGIGENHSGGPGGGALISTPVSIGNGTWDVKVVLGDARVHEDGSAFFTVPARTPVYFQALDERSRAVQTMRSWTTLQPAESQSCVGCHDHKNAAPPPGRVLATQAQRAGPQKLEPFYGPPRGFSFRTEVQPILDRHCVSCHNDRDAAAGMLTGGAGQPAASSRNPEAQRSFSLLGEEVLDPVAKRRWSEAYLVLTGSRLETPSGPWRGSPHGPLVNWISSQSVPTPLPPRAAGSARSRLMSLLDEGHKEVKLSREELDKLACWIDLLVPFSGDYTEANAWTPAEQGKYEHFMGKRRRMAELLQRTESSR